MLALICRERLVDAIRAEAICMADEPIPLVDRPARIAALEREIEELSRIEEAEAAIARGERVSDRRQPSGQAVLGVKVREAAWARCRDPHCRVDITFRRRYLSSGLEIAPPFPPAHACRRAVPLGRWTEINSREPGG